MLSVLSVGAVDVQSSKAIIDANFNLDSDRSLSLNVTICFENFIIGNKKFNYNCARLKSKKHPSKPQDERIIFESRRMDVTYKTDSLGGKGYKFSLQNDQRDDTSNFYRFLKQFTNQEKAIFGSICKRASEKKFVETYVIGNIKENSGTKSYHEFKKKDLDKFNLNQTSVAFQSIGKRCLKTIEDQIGKIVLKERLPCHSISELKKIQNWLKNLDFYKGTVDGMWGPATKKAIDEYRASTLIFNKEYCLQPWEFSRMHSDAKKRLDQKLKAEAERKARKEAKRREMECRVDQLDKCSEEDICKKATVLSEGVRRWDLDKVDFWQRAVELDLDCDIKVDKTPYLQGEAQKLITQLVEYVQNNSEYFDINFAVEFNKIRPIIEGEWTKDLSDSFEDFRQYLTKYPQFTAYLEEKRKKAEEVIAQRISKLQSELDKIIEILREWGLKNILDEKAAEIYDLSESVKGDMYKTINGLEQLLSQSQKLLNAINE